MKVGKTKKLFSRVLSLFAASAVLISTGVALADTKPHFTTNDGGLFAGGWFRNAAGSCDTRVDVPGATYQAPNYSSLSSTRYRGAIMGYANTSVNPRVGAHSNVDAFALGLIEGSDPTPGNPNYGFYSGTSGNGSLSFANVAGGQTSYWGGLFEGSGAKPNHCIPDYYGTKRQGTPPNWPGNLNAGTSGQFQINSGGSPYNMSGGTIPAGTKLTIFVNGDIYINSNITYGPHDASNVQKFALVVRGNIYIGPSVNRLDGWYIAQPSNANNGVLWTCYNIGDPTPPPDDVWVRSNCGNSLNFFGAVTAKQVNLLRTNGGLGSGSPGTSAEVVNFTPEMVIGGPFFNLPQTPGQGLDSLVSLPPVF